MPILVDTNVILDITSDDPLWGDWADEQITKYRTHGLVVNPVIYAELCAHVAAFDEVDGVLDELKLSYLDSLAKRFF